MDRSSRIHRWMSIGDREDVVKQAGSRAIETACCASVMDAPLGEQDAVDLAAVFAALGDPVRLRLLSLIAAADEVCSCNLEGPLERSQPTISHHTKILAAAGLIEGDKRGRWVWWRVVPQRVDEVRAALGRGT